MARLQKTPHQVGEQIAVAADRGVGAARQFRMVLAQLRIERFSHAVQALKLEPAFAARQLHDGCDRQRVMVAKLREQAPSKLQELSGASDQLRSVIAFSREHRIAGKPTLLRALDLGVPIGTLTSRTIMRRFSVVASRLVNSITAAARF